ncbi:MAG: uridine kinase [Gemmatimonadota bacterium]
MPDFVKAFVVGIAGGSGSGKSAVARSLARRIAPHSVALVEMDAYYRNQGHLTLDERRQLNWDHPDAVDLDLFLEQLARLRAGSGISRPVYDFATHLRRSEAVFVDPAEVVVVEGILLFSDDRARALCDIKVFVDVDADVRLIRRIRRDMNRRARPLDEILDQYTSTVQPMHVQFVEPSKRHADIIVPGGSHNAVAMDLLVASIQERMRRNASS